MIESKHQELTFEDRNVDKRSIIVCTGRIWLILCIDILWLITMDPSNKNTTTICYRAVDKMWQIFSRNTNIKLTPVLTYLDPRLISIWQCWTVVRTWSRTMLWYGQNREEYFLTRHIGFGRSGASRKVLYWYKGLQLYSISFEWPISEQLKHNRPIEQKKLLGTSIFNAEIIGTQF